MRYIALKTCHNVNSPGHDASSAKVVREVFGPRILVGLADSCPPAPVTRSTAQVRAIVRHETYVVDLKRFLSSHHYPGESDRSEVV